jgi:nitrite reductase (NADH) small subunit/3-phenylpropionate/trans-cinnamate dioxygenase ferredoxin subunit
LSELVRAATVDQIPEDEGFVVEIKGREIAIFCCSGQYYAVENSCPHRGGPVAEGELENETITCPWHAWPFDLRTGECTINSAAKLQTFQVQLQDGQVFIALDVED